METYEKKYKDAKKWIESIYTELSHERQMEAEAFFPELKESVYERIRKTFIRYVKSWQQGYCAWNSDKDFCNIAIAWLEKQGKQILANSAKTCKVEPKFKVGDWVLWDNKICYHINDIHQGEKYLVYTITDTNNLIRSYAVECFDKNARIWTIDDAKDGDILASAGVIFIFNKVHSIWISCHCSLHKDKSFIDEDYNLMHIKYSKEVYPATKEECDLLFKKMKEAGYEWDAEKKELKKIDQKSVEENKGNVGKTSSNCSKECEKIITASLLQNNGFIFSEERFETHECYYKELNNEVDVSLLICYGTDKWLLEIMFNNCEQELVKFVSTVEELQKCLDIMGVELKIKY